MSTEQRVVRPYVGLDGFETIFGQFRLRVGSEMIEPARSIHLESGDYLVTKVAVELAASEELWHLTRVGLVKQAHALGMTPDELELVVIASTSFLKMADVVVRCPLSQLDSIERVIPLSTPARPRALQAVHHGASVDVFLCLARDVMAEPLRPSRAGTWVARAEFRLSTDFDAIGFRPRPLTAADRERFGLPTGTIRYIDIPVSPLEDIRADDAVELWVDADLLSQLSLGSKTAASRAFQMQLFLDAVAALSERARQVVESHTTIDDLDDTFLGRMIRAIAGNTSTETSSQDLLDLMRDEPGKFMAYVEARSGIAKELARVIDELVA